MADLSIGNTIFRNFRKEDLKEIAIIEELCINPPWSYKSLCEFSEYDTSRILVASCNGKICGYVTYSVVLDEVQVANVAVHPQQQRHGIAENLLKVLYTNSKSNGMCTITLEVRESNMPALCLYKKCGYKEVGRRKNYYKSPTEDAILMNLDLL